MSFVHSNPLLLHVGSFRRNVAVRSRDITIPEGESTMTDTSGMWPDPNQLIDFALSLNSEQAGKFKVWSRGKTTPTRAELQQFIADAGLNDAQQRSFIDLYLRAPHTTPQPAVVDLTDPSITEEDLRTAYRTGNLPGGAAVDKQAVLDEILSRLSVSGAPAPAPAPQPAFRQERWQGQPDQVRFERQPRRRVPHRETVFEVWLKAHVATLILMLVGLVVYFIFRSHVDPLIVTTPHAMWWVDKAFLALCLLVGGLIGHSSDRRRNYGEYFYDSNTSTRS